MNTQIHAGKNYMIVIEGHLGPGWVDWPWPVKISHGMEGNEKYPVSILTVTLPDQPALHSLLDKIRDLNLTLISFQRSDPANLNTIRNGSETWTHDLNH